MLLTLAATLALLAQAAAPAAPAPPAAKSPAPPPAAAAEKQVCKDVNNEGSRITHQECHTQAEWDQLTGDTNAMARPPH